MNITRKQFSAKVSSPENGVIEAIVAVFGNVDRVGDRIKPGFFKESIERKMPKGVWMHRWDQPIAKTLEAKETEEGLYIKAQFNLDTQRGREAYSDIKFGIVDEFSIGYDVLEEVRSEDGINELIKGELFEWSPVLIGANPETRLVSLKDLSSGDLPDGMPLDTHAEAVLAALSGLATRAQEIRDMRSKDGRDVSKSSLARLKDVHDGLEGLRDALATFLEPEAPPSKSTAGDLRLEVIRESALKRRDALIGEAS